MAVSKKTTIYLRIRHYILPFKNYQVDFERLMIFRARKKGKKLESGYGFEKLGLEMEQPFLQEFVFLRASAPPREELL